MSGLSDQSGSGKALKEESSAVEGLDNSTVFTTEQCLQLLAGQTVGRVSFSARALPAIIPVRYWLTDDEIYLRLGNSEWMPQLRGSHVMLLQIDQIFPDSMTGWQVTATGMAAPLPGRDGGNPELPPAHLTLRPQLITGHPIEFGADGGIG